MAGSCADGASSVAAAFSFNMHRAARLLAAVRSCRSEGGYARPALPPRGRFRHGYSECAAVACSSRKRSTNVRTTTAMLNPRVWQNCRNRS